MKQFIDGVKLACKWEHFYNSERRGIAMFQVRSIAGLHARGVSRGLNSWNFPQDREAYLESRVEGQAAYWQARRELQDDLFPTLCPHYGIAEHTAFLGGEVVFEETTSYNLPALTAWADAPLLHLDENHPWLRMVVDGIRYYRERHGDRFFTRLRGADGISDIANVLRGNALFLDVYDHPEELQKLLAFCVKAARFTLEKQKEVAEPVGNGFINGFDIWMPRNSIGHISEDASCMLSCEQFEEQFLPHLKALCRGYDHVLLHVHSLGKKNLPQFASIPEITMLDLTSDPGCARGIAVAREYEACLQNKILVMNLTRQELEENADFLAHMKTVIWYNAKHLEDALETTRWMNERFGI